jgi:hypothetical protein
VLDVDDFGTGIPADFDFTMGDDFGLNPIMHYSYCYAQPYCRNAMHTSSEGGRAVAADRNPFIDADPAYQWLNDTSSQPEAAWANFDPFPPGDMSGIAGTSIKKFQVANTPSHNKEGQNVLYTDIHVTFEKRAFCAVASDNIYTVAGGGNVEQGMTPGSGPASTPSDGPCTPYNHMDSVLVNDRIGLAKGRICFPAGTPVWVNGGLVQISRVAVGQKVGKVGNPWAAVSLKQIESVDEHEGTYKCYDIVLESGNRISVANWHAFLLDSNRWVAVQDLRAGMRLKSLKGPIGISSVAERAIPYTGRVYNLKVEDSDRYFVGVDGVIVRDW